MKATKINRIAAIALAAVIGVSTVACGNNSINKTTSSATINKTASTSAKTAEYKSLFKKDGVIDIKVDILEADWKSMMDDPMAEEYKSADVTVNGVTVKNVGFRTKGNLTLRSVANSDSDRFSFNFKLDKFVDKQNLLGLDEFVVNNMYSDPSYMREYLTYEALRSIGAKVPDTVYANLYINGKLYGLYLCIEAVDDSFLKTNFGDNDGNLYRQDQGSSLQYVEGSNYDKSSQKQGNDESKTDLKNFIKVLNEMPAGQKGNIESVLDVDSALKYIAANTVLGSYDSYNGNLTQNYYLYGQNGKFTVIPWDYNMSFGGFSMGGGDQTTVPIDEPVLGVNIKNVPMINNLLAVPEYKVKYHEYVKQLVDYLGNFETRVNELATVIRPYVQADPTKFYTMEQFEANIKYSETTASTNNGANAMPDAPQNAPQSRPDTNTGASQNTNGNAQNGAQGMPAGNQKGDRQLPPAQDVNAANRPQGMPGDFQNGDRQMPQQDFRGGNMKGGPGGGGPNMMGGSIINYVRARVANIKK